VWAVLDLAVGRFGHIKNLWAVLVGAVLVHGPFWYRPFHDTAKECHLPYGITQCYLLPDTSEHTPP